MRELILVGNPNCGKTTLFNALTGDNQKVGNWPGVTVEKKTGSFILQGESFHITDLPGIYSLSAHKTCKDEQIAAQAIIDLKADCIINIVDACHLERHLYLTSQLLELGKPMILVVNMSDIAQQRGIQIDTVLLSQLLHCPAVSLQAHKQIGREALEKALLGSIPESKSLALSLPEELDNLLTEMAQKIENTGLKGPLPYYYALRALEGDVALTKQYFASDALLEKKKEDLDSDMLLADARYGVLHQVVQKVQHKRSDASNYFTARLDRIVLHRFWAMPIFLGLMYLMFVFSINIGGVFQDFFDISTDTIFVQGTAWLLQTLHMPNWVIAILANGLGKGINTTLTFIPVIASMFFFLSLLESSGYMARAAFVVDKIMRILGLPGKSFVPMIVGFGCNVPAIMAARTLDNERDRLLTVMMSPFMSCSARLAIYAVFVAAFFPTGGQNVVFSLYLLGIIMAVFTGFLLRKTSLRGQAAPLILELPVYHKPSLSRLLKETRLRLRFFVLRAGKLIIPVCVILGALNAITLDGGISTGEANTQSLLSLVGQWLTPLFAPMGLQQNNWPATVGLLTGMLAKEVVVGSLNSLYAQIAHVGQAAAVDFNIWVGLKAAWNSIGENIAQLGQALWNPIAASAPDGEVSQTVYGMMASRFSGKAGAYAYLLFILLYIPCVSTMAVIRQEASKSMMWFSIIWSFVLAYAAAVIFYQLSQFSLHPLVTIFWIVAMIAAMGLVIFFFRCDGRKGEGDAYTTA